MISPEQCRMARAGLGWSARDLASAARVGLATVQRFENGQVTPIPATLTAIQRALETAGVEFRLDGSVRLNAGAAAAAGS
jgi:transcriptional regulator with XRE-family HTH domain